MELRKAYKAVRYLKEGLDDLKKSYKGFDYCEHPSSDRGVFFSTSINLSLKERFQRAAKRVLGFKKPLQGLTSGLVISVKRVSVAEICKGDIAEITVTGGSRVAYARGIGVDSALSVVEEEFVRFKKAKKPLKAGC